VLEDVALLVQCGECGAYGKVTDPTADEWQQAFHAPSNRYKWPDNERVELLPGISGGVAKWPDETRAVNASGNINAADIIRDRLNLNNRRMP
jgi:hypothetical protein